MAMASSLKSANRILYTFSAEGRRKNLKIVGKIKNIKGLCKEENMNIDIKEFQPKLACLPP